MEGIALLKRGCDVIKFSSKSSKPAVTLLRLSINEAELSWQRHGLAALKRKSEGRVLQIRDVTGLLVGRESATFQRAHDDAHGAVHLSLSLVLEGSRTSFDLCCVDEEQFGYLVAGLRALLSERDQRIADEQRKDLPWGGKALPSAPSKVPTVPTAPGDEGDEDVSDEKRARLKALKAELAASQAELAQVRHGQSSVERQKSAGTWAAEAEAAAKKAAELSATLRKTPPKQTPPRRSEADPDSPNSAGAAKSWLKAAEAAEGYGDVSEPEEEPEEAEEAEEAEAEEAEEAEPEEAEEAEEAEPEEAEEAEPEEAEPEEAEAAQEAQEAEEAEEAEEAVAEAEEAEEAELEEPEPEEAEPEPLSRNWKAAAEATSSLGDFGEPLDDEPSAETALDVPSTARAGPTEVGDFGEEVGDFGEPVAEEPRRPSPVKAAASAPKLAASPAKAEEGESEAAHRVAELERRVKELEAMLPPTPSQAGGHAAVGSTGTDDDSEAESDLGEPLRAAEALFAHADAPPLAEDEADALFRRVSKYGLGGVAGGADDEEDEDEVDRALRRALALSDESIALAKDTAEDLSIKPGTLKMAKDLFDDDAVEKPTKPVQRPAANPFGTSATKSKPPVPARSAEDAAAALFGSDDVSSPARERHPAVASYPFPQAAAANPFGSPAPSAAANPFGASAPAVAANPFGALAPAVAPARHSSKPEVSKQNPFGGGPPAPPPPAPPPPRAEVSKQASNPFGGGAPASASPPPRTHGSSGGKNPFAKAPAATTAPARKETAEEIAARMMAEIDDI